MEVIPDSTKRAAAPEDLHGIILTIEQLLKASR